MKQTEPVTLREPTPDDAETIAKIIKASYEGLDAHHVPYDMPAYRPELHAEMMGDPATRWVLLYEGKTPSGVAMWRMLPNMSHLHLLFVDSARQGHGHGVRLLHHHQKSARDEAPDLRLYTLHCLRDSHWAMRFYKHQGYTLYEPGDEGRLTDLYLWIDACRAYSNGWPLPPEKALFYKIVR